MLFSNLSRGLKEGTWNLKITYLDLQSVQHNSVRYTEHVDMELKKLWRTAKIHNTMLSLDVRLPKGLLYNSSPAFHSGLIPVDTGLVLVAHELHAAANDVLGPMGFWHVLAKLLDACPRVHRHWKTHEYKQLEPDGHKRAAEWVQTQLRALGRNGRGRLMRAAAHLHLTFMSAQELAETILGATE